VVADARRVRDGLFGDTSGAIVRLAERLSMRAADLSSMLGGNRPPTRALVEGLYGPSGSQLLPELVAEMEAAVAARQSPGAAAETDSRPSEAVAVDAAALVVAPSLEPAREVAPDPSAGAEGPAGGLDAVLRHELAALRQRLAAVDAKAEALQRERDALLAEAIGLESKIRAAASLLALYEGDGDGDAGAEA